MRSPNHYTRSLSPLKTKYPLALEAVEVLREAPAVGDQVMTFYYECEEGINLIKGIENPKEVAWSVVCGQGKQIAEGRRYEARELLLGEQF